MNADGPVATLPSDPPPICETDDGATAEQRVSDKPRVSRQRWCQFRVRGHVADLAGRAFPDVEIALDGADTLLTVRLLEWSALYGVVDQIERLGLELLGIRPLIRSAGTQI